MNESQGLRQKNITEGQGVRRRHRLAKALAILIILGMVAVLGLNMYVRHEGGQLLRTAEAISYTEDNPADCALILGAAVYADQTPTPMLQDRLDKGIELYKAGVVKKLLLSGDNGQVEYNEVEVMKKYALEAGVDEEDIFLDHAGFSTYESVYRAKAVFNVQSMIIVTQEYHEFRALYIAKQFGLEVEGVSAEDIDYAGDFAREIRETLARDKDWAKCIFQPEPTFLGDVIDIEGDGQRSW